MIAVHSVFCQDMAPILPRHGTGKWAKNEPRYGRQPPPSTNIFADGYLSRLQAGARRNTPSGRRSASDGRDTFSLKVFQRNWSTASIHDKKQGADILNFRKSTRWLSNRLPSNPRICTYQYILTIDFWGRAEGQGTTRRLFVVVVGNHL